MIISSSYFLELIKSKKKLSEVLVPKLIYRLVRESLNSNTYTHFPSGDDVFTPGWDGLIDGNDVEHRFLPKGNSYFEIGAKKNCYKSFTKIDSDYEKRKVDSTILNKTDYSYVAVTTSILDSKKKENYVQKYEEENIFKKILILDAVDITNWMEDHIDICIWFLQSYGEKIDDYDITLLSDEWDRISLCTTPNFSLGLFKVGNERNSAKLIKDLEEVKSNRIITISSKYYGKDFALSFCIATLMDSSNDDLKERTIIANSQSAMNYVNAFCSGKIVLVNFNCLDDRFAVNLNNTYIFFDSLFGDDIKLEMIQQKEFEKEVEKLGYSCSDAYKISYAIDYNTLALRRLLTKIPSIKVPSWSKNHDKNELIPLLLLGEINMDNQGSLGFIKAIVGEDLDLYTEKLNLWSEMSQSPILKYENTYRICSRKECFDFLQVDIFSSKLKKVEELLTIALTEIDGKYKKDKEKWIINDGSYKWNYRLIENIINGFIILSEKNKKNQIHFDSFVEKIFSSLYGNYELSLTLATFFHILAELSPNSYLAYMRKSINEDRINYLKFIKTSSPGLIMNNCLIHDVLYALEIALKIEQSSLSGFELLLDIYYLVDDDKFVLDEVMKYLSPVSTMTGLIVIPLSQKIEFFFNYVAGKADEKTSIIVNKLYGDNNDNVMIGVSHSYRTFVTQEIKVTYSEILEMKARAFTWLIDHEKNSNELITTIKKVLQNIHQIPINDIKNQLSVIESKALSADDEIKALICREILRTRENILKYSNWKGLLSYITTFDEILKKIEPVDDYMKVKYLLINDNYPVINPPSFDEVDWYQKTNLLRGQEKEDKLKDLASKYSQQIIERIINDSDENSGIIWPLIYKISNDHIRDVNQIINKNLFKGLRIYLNILNNDELNIILEKYENDIRVVPNLPFSKKIYKWIDGKFLEKEYWINQYFGNANEDFEYLFNKFIEFSPLKLVETCTYFAEIDYEHSIKLLKAISKLIGDGSKAKELNNEVYSIQEFVDKMDKKYYTDELSLCEFQLLPILKSGLQDYPMGIKKYFWDNPEELGKLLVQLNKQKDVLLSGSIGQKLIFEAYCAFGGGCYIPQDYLLEHREQLKEWANGVLKSITDEENNVKRLVKSAVVNTLACCPRNIKEDIWPIVEVADILEEISKVDYDDKFRVSSNFYCGYVNRRGIRSVEDGSAEFALSNEFRKYQDYYKFSHPVISKALEYISNSYNNEAEKDRIRSYLGFED